MASIRTQTFQFLYNIIAKEKEKKKAPFFVFISGIDCAGKTSFSKAFRDFILLKDGKVQLIHLDDFHNQKKYRYDDKNPITQYYDRSFDFCRLIEEIIKPIKTESALNKSMTVLDVDSDEFTLQRHYQVDSTSIILLEGVFLGRPILRSFCDMFVQLEVPFSVAFDRAKLRDVPRQGKSVLQKYVSKYLPTQFKYLQKHNPSYYANFIINNIVPDAPEIRSNLPLFLPDPLKDEENQSNAINCITNCWKTSSKRRFDAVCFDFWNTLVPLSNELKESAFRTTASILNMDSELLRPIWRQKRKERETTELSLFLNNLCQYLNISSENNKVIVKEVMRHRYAIHGSAMSNIRNDAECTLKMLRAANYKLGLVSNCTSDVPKMIENVSSKISFDAATFSCFEGLMKPTTEIFLRAADKLGIPPSKCLYIGDGNDSELSGAESAGMTPVLLKTHSQIDWKGHKIDSLFDVFNLIDL